MTTFNTTWRTVCDTRRLAVERGVAALLLEGQVAVFRTRDGALYCVSHHDPFSGANVIARGIIGSTVVDGSVVPTIASPMYKQVFDLRDGGCLSDRSVTLGSWLVRDDAGQIQIGSCRIAPTGRADG